MPEDFIRDLYSLDLTDGIFDFLLEVKLNPSLRLEMESLGFDPLKLELFFDTETEGSKQTKFDKINKLKVVIDKTKTDLSQEIELIEKMKEQAESIAKQHSGFPAHIEEVNATIADEYANISKQIQEMNAWIANTSTQIKKSNESIAKAEQILSEEKLSVVEMFVHSFWDDMIEPKMDTLIKDLAKNSRSIP
jgi:predicted enzyme involved in methoxymalonyl-ACP biosynthesis